LGYLDTYGRESISRRPAATGKSLLRFASLRSFEKKRFASLRHVVENEYEGAAAGAGTVRRTYGMGCENNEDQKMKGKKFTSPLS
jgi:hypothetical protein